MSTETSSSDFFDTECSCPCGKTRFQVETKPILRFFCHCKICQKLYDKAYSDVNVVRTKHVHLPDSGIEFSSFRAPPALQRGLCSHCHKPVAGLLTMLPGLKLAFIAGENFSQQDKLPEPLGHVFYHRKRQNCEDSLPKIGGYWRSEWQISKWLLPRLMHS